MKIVSEGIILDATVMEILSMGHESNGCKEYVKKNEYTNTDPNPRIRSKISQPIVFFPKKKTLYSIMKYTCYKNFQEWSLEYLELDMEFLIVFLCSAIAVIGLEQLTSKTRLP